jgi:hypothetical protein
MTRAPLLLGVLLALGCTKPSGLASTEPASSASTSPAPSVAAIPSASAAPASAPKTWKGTYKSSAASLAVPPDFAKAWAHADRGGGTGEGAMTLAIDGATNLATGTVDGPLGPALVAGEVAEGTLTASVRRKDPSDCGFTGTLRATVTADRIDGTMSLASADGSVQRTASMTLTPSAP